MGVGLEVGVGDGDGDGDGIGAGVGVGVGVGCSCPYPPAFALIAKAIRKAMVDLLISIFSSPKNGSQHDPSFRVRRGRKSSPVACRVWFSSLWLTRARRFSEMPSAAGCVRDR